MNHPLTVIRHFCGRAIFAAMLLVVSSTGLSAQVLSYIVPDLGTPGMNTYVEFIGPADAPGNFGADGLYLNNPGDAVRIVCADPADSAKVTIGPVVVSWNGRMASTQVFVHPSVQPNSDDWRALRPEFLVKLVVLVAGRSSNGEPFALVRPQPALRPVSGQLIGAGGLGIRSRRGAMIVDSIVLGDAQVGVSTNDVDPAAQGNQGYLPFVLISLGRVTGRPGSAVSVTASGKDAGPGGGGGGGNYCDVTGGGSDGGGGFTGGGRGGRNGSNVPFSSDEWRQPGSSTGGIAAATGVSLNGVAGGTSPAYEAAGGGTGHPFGTSGLGCNDGLGCRPNGGYGGGSGYQQTRGGGGGGYASDGSSVAGTNNGGLAHGNAALVPLAGGSGGAGGNPQGLSVCSGEGGGGGGAIRLYAPAMSNVDMYAHGGGGQNRANGPGGSGSGGGISVETRLGYSFATVGAEGGAGPLAGGSGRVRLDGPRSTIAFSSPRVSNFRGPSTDTSRYVPRSFVLTGTGSGDEILVYLRSPGMPWTRIADIPVYTNYTWSLGITLPGDESVYYLTVLQKQVAASSDPYAAEPQWILSQAAANTLIFKAYARTAGVQEHRVPALVCESSATHTVHVRNEGDGLLELRSAAFVTGHPSLSIVSPAFPATVAPGDSIPVVVRFAPAPGSIITVSDTLLIQTNDTARARNPWPIYITASKDSAGLVSASQDIRISDLLLCNAASADTVFTIENSGTVVLLLRPPVLSGPFELISPLPSAFPMPFDPAMRTMQFRVRYRPSRAGLLENGSIAIRGEAPGCPRDISIALSGRADSAALTTDAAAVFRTLLCAGESADTTVRILNTGTIELTITQPVTSNPRFQIIAPPFPLKIGAGSGTDVRLRFAPDAAGTEAGLFIATAEPCSLPLRIDLSGRRDSSGLATSTTDFGLLPLASFPAERDLAVTNTGDRPIRIDQATLRPGGPFVITAGIPVDLSPGATAMIRIRFTDPGSDGVFSDTIRFGFSPGCGETPALVTGARGTAAVTLETDTLFAAPGEIVEVPIYLRSGINPRLFGATGIRTTLRYNADILEPLDVVSGNIAGGERFIPLTLPLVPDARNVLVTLRFRAMLGRVESTTLILDSATGIGGQLAITSIPGVFTLVNICREGGTRLFDGSVRATLAQNAPNPFNPETDISYTIIENGRVRLDVYDALGRLVTRLVDAVQGAGTHHVRFYAGGLPSGTYQYVLQTETMVLTRSMLLAK